MDLIQFKQEVDSGNFDYLDDKKFLDEMKNLQPYEGIYYKFVCFADWIDKNIDKTIKDFPNYLLENPTTSNTFNILFNKEPYNPYFSDHFENDWYDKITSLVFENQVNNDLFVKPYRSMNIELRFKFFIFVCASCIDKIDYEHLTINKNPATQFIHNYKYNPCDYFYLNKYYHFLDNEWYMENLCMIKGFINFLMFATDLEYANKIDFDYLINKEINNFGIYGFLFKNPNIDTKYTKDAIDNTISVMNFMLNTNNLSRVLSTKNCKNILKHIEKENCSTNDFFFFFENFFKINDKSHIGYSSKEIFEDFVKIDFSIKQLVRIYTICDKSFKEDIENLLRQKGFNNFIFI